MAEISNLPFSRKGKKIVLTWIENNFKPNLLGTSDFEFLESPQFETEESVYKIRLIPGYTKCPDRVACVLIKVDPDILPFAQYFVDVEVKIDSETWNLPVNTCSDFFYAPLMKVSYLRDENNFLPECKLTVKFGLRRCMFSRPCSRYASATTEFPVTTTSRIISFKNFKSSAMQQESIEEERVRNELAPNVRNEVVPNELSVESRRLHWIIERQDGTNSFRIVLRTGGLSLLVRYEINLVDVRNDIVISSSLRQPFISGSESFIFVLLVPPIFLEEFENPSAAFEELNGHVIVSNYSEEQTTIHTNELERGSYFFSDGKKRFTLNSDLKNYYYNGTEGADFWIKTDKKTFSVHRDILAVRSPVFEAMFKNDTVGKITGVLVIEEMNPEELSLFLKFIYTSELEKNIGFETATSLYIAADKYGILCMLPICRRELIKNMSVTNFDDLFILSYLHRDREIKESIRSFLIPRYFNSEEFSHLDNLFVLNRPLTEADIESLRSLKNKCGSMPINYDP